MLRLLSSVQLAVWLIAALAGFSVASTLFDFPELFQSWPFRLTALAFFINLLLCSVQLWPGLVRTLAKKPKAWASTDWKTSEHSEDKVLAILKEEGLRTESVKAGGEQYLLARKKRLGLLGPHILHVGLLLILIGAFLSSFQSQGQLALYEGQTHALPTAIAESYGEAEISVQDFSTVYDQHGALDNWVTTFSLKDGDGLKEDLTTKVNAPYKHKGLTVYQMAYNNRYIVQLEGTAEVDGDYALPEDQRFPMGLSTFKIVPMTEDLPLLMIYDENDLLVNQVPLYRDTVYSFPDGSSLTYLAPHFATILQLKYDRSIPVVFAGFLISVLGSMAMLIGRYEEIRVHIQAQGPLRLRVQTKNTERKSQLEEKLGIHMEREHE